MCAIIARWYIPEKSKLTNVAISPAPEHAEDEERERGGTMWSHQYYVPDTYDCTH